MHNGQIGEYCKVRHDLEMTLPPDLYPLRLGSTDSELIFLLMIKNGLEEAPICAVQKTIGDILETMDKFEVTEALRFTACLSNGEEILAIRYANDDQAPSLYVCEQDHALLVASEPLNTSSQKWWSLPQGECLHIKDGGSIHHPFVVT